MPKIPFRRGIVIEVFERRGVFAAFKALTAVDETVDESSHLLSGDRFVCTEGGVGSTFGNADAFEQSDGFSQSFILGVYIGKFGFCGANAESEHSKQHSNRQTDGENTRGFSHIGFLLHCNLYAYTK